MYLGVPLRRSTSRSSRGNVLARWSILWTKWWTTRPPGTASSARLKGGISGRLLQIHTAPCTLVLDGGCQTPDGLSRMWIIRTPRHRRQRLCGVPHPPRWCPGQPCNSRGTWQSTTPLDLTWGSWALHLLLLPMMHGRRAARGGSQRRPPGPCGLPANCAPGSLAETLHFPHCT